MALVPPSNGPAIEVACTTLAFFGTPSEKLGQVRVRSFTPKGAFETELSSKPLGTLPRGARPTISSPPTWLSPCKRPRTYVPIPPG